MAFCTFLWFGSVLSRGKARCIFADPCAHQQFRCRSTRTIWWVCVILQSWADWQRVQNLHARKLGFMIQREELAGFLALEISIKGVYFVLETWSQLPQSATDTCCNTRVLAKQLVGGWWWKFKEQFLKQFMFSPQVLRIRLKSTVWDVSSQAALGSLWNTHAPCWSSRGRHLSRYFFFFLQWQVDEHQ